MPAQDLPNIAQMTTRLAANQARVTNYVDTLATRIDELVAATGREDWDEVGQLSGRLAQQSRDQGHRSISALAQQVHEKAEQPHQPLGLKRSLLRLIGQCGRVRSR